MSQDRRILHAWHLHGEIDAKEATGWDRETGHRVTLRLPDPLPWGHTIRYSSENVAVEYDLSPLSGSAQTFAAAYEEAYLTPVSDQMQEEARPAYLQASLKRGSFEVEFDIADDTLSNAYATMTALLKKMKIRQPRGRRALLLADPLTIHIHHAAPGDLEIVHTSEPAAAPLVILPGTQIMFEGAHPDLPTVELPTEPTPAPLALPAPAPQPTPAPKAAPRTRRPRKGFENVLPRYTGASAVMFSKSTAGGL